MNWSDPYESLAVGDDFVSPGRTVTEADVVGFAALTGDWHPQHADAEWARDSVFGERIAHGMLVISVAAGLVPFDPERVVALRRVGDAVFKRPVRLGDTIRVRGRIAELKAPGLVSFAWTVVNQHDETCCRARVDVLWKGKGSDPSASGPERSGTQGSDPGAADHDFVPIPL